MMEKFRDIHFVKCCIDDFLIYGKSSESEVGHKAELASAIKSSKVFLCCITKDYCKSYNCNLEVEYANAKKKPMISLMIEKIDPTDIDDIQVTDRDQTSGIGFIIK